MDDSENTAKIKVVITDTGRGMPKEKLPLLFKPYSQIKEKKWNRVEGTGLGLMICKEFITLMKGDIDVQSDEGIGTKVQFTAQLKKVKDQVTTSTILPKEEPKTVLHELPDIQADKFHFGKVDNLHDKEDIEMKEQPQKKFEIKLTKENGDAQSKISKKRLLLVEDNPISQKVEMKLLRDSGYHVDAVGNGFDAIDAVKNGEFDLVLMDIEMPGMDGLTATQKIRELGINAAEIPIIAVTAHSSMKDREKCLTAGMDDYIAKPININFMKITIDQWLNKKQWKKETE